MNIKIPRATLRRYSLSFGVLCMGTVFAFQASAQGSLVASYSFDSCDWETNGIAVDAVGGHDGVASGGVNRNEDATSGIKPETCSSAEFSGGAIDVTGLPISTSPGGIASVSFWMYWDGTNSMMPIGWQYHDLWFHGGAFGFNSGSADIFGVSSAGLANSWHHIAVVFNNNNLTNNKMYIDGVLQPLTRRRSSPNNSRAVVDSHLRIGGWWGTTGYRFRGKLDELKVYAGEVNQTQVNAEVAATAPSCPNCPPPPPAVRVARYTFDDEWDLSGTLADSFGSADGTRTGSVSRISAPAQGLKPNSCFAGDFRGGAFDIYGLPVSTASGDTTSVSFWMYWDGTNSVMPIGWQHHDLWFYGGSFGFNSAGGDIRGISSAGLANSWHHVAVVFTNNNLTKDKMYIDGVLQTLSQRRGSPNNSRAVVSSHLRISGWWANNSYRFRGMLDEVNIFTGSFTDAQVLVEMNTGCDNQVAWFQMEQSSWDGSASEVLDESGSDHHATARNDANTGDLEPALSGDPGTCGYGEFDGIDDYLEVSSSFPDLDSDFSIAAWIRPGSTSGTARIFADDENNTNGFALSLGDGGDGELRFISRGVSPVNVDTLAAGLTADTWYFVVAVHDSTAKSRQIYVNGIAQSLTGGTTAATYTGTWGTDVGLASIGGETGGSAESASSYYFQGFIDEVRAYDVALSQAEISALYTETHVCSTSLGLDHFEIDPGSVNASTCSPKSVTISACATNGCGTKLTTYVGTADLSTSSSHGNWSKSSALGTLSPAPDSDGNGSASYTFSASDNGVAVFDLANANADDLTITVTDPAASIANSSSLVQFRDNVFVIDEDPLQVAGRDQSMTATLWQRDGSDCSVATGYSGVQPLKVWLTRDFDDPGGLAPTIGGTVVPESPSTAFNLTFSAGVSSFNLGTADVGKYVLSLRDDSGVFATGVDIDSDAVTLMTRAFGFDLVASTALGGSNPAASSAADAAFASAGVAFEVSARAVLWQSGDDTDNNGIPDNHGDTDPSNNADLSDNAPAPAFGQEGTPESVVLNASLVLPAGGNDSGISSSAITSFAVGIGSSVNVVFNEVGIIEIKASLSDNSYLGAGDIIGASGYVGRFIPDHFALSGVLLSNRQDSATQIGCVSSFTFLDEDLEIIFDLSAENVFGATTQNYTGSFAKLNSLSSLGDASGILANALNLVGSHAGNVHTPADRLSGTAPSIAIVNGTTSSTVALNFQMDRINSGGPQPEVPLDGIEFGINPIDSDGVESNGTLMVGAPSGPENFTSVGTTNLYFGRAVVENAHGSELEAIKIWAHTEYCAAVDATPACTQWIDLSQATSQDDCTKFSILAPADTSIVDYWQGGASYGADSEAFFRPYDSLAGRGGGGWRMRYTGPGSSLQTDIPDLGSDTVETIHDYLLLQQGSVTFGIYRGNDHIIYMRETY